MRRSSIDIHCLLMLKWERYRRLSNCKRFLIFRSKFPTLPRKISAYLRAELSSGANTRIMRGFHNILNINDLYLRVFFRFAKSTISACNKAHIGGRNAPYRTLIWALSYCEMGNIGTRNWLFRTTLWGISEGGSDRNGPYHNGFNIPSQLFCENILSK